MESNKNNDNNRADEEHEQLRESAQKHKLNELTNDGDKPGGEGDQPELGECSCSSSKKNRDEGNDMDLELESLSREELIKLVRKLMETAKKQDDEKEIADDQPMKIQLSLETWYDWLEFVPHRQLGQIIPMIGDRKFAEIVQGFLHKYGELMIDDIEIVAPYEEDPTGPHPRVRAWQYRPLLRFEMAEAQMPANIKSFHLFVLSYFDEAVLNFMQKFKQNGLLDNVNLSFAKLPLPSKDLLPTVLCHILPLIKGIVSVEVQCSSQLVDIYDDAENSKEIYERNMKMMEETRILHVISSKSENLRANIIDLYCRWLYQSARADGEPRVLFLIQTNVDSAPISLFIDRIKEDFELATDPVCFSIRIDLPKAFQPQEDICLDNNKTKERLLIKMKEVEWKVLLIARYPLASTEEWIVANEEEVFDWDWERDFSSDKTIYVSGELKVVPF